MTCTDEPSSHAARCLTRRRSAGAASCSPSTCRCGPPATSRSSRRIRPTASSRPTPSSASTQTGQVTLIMPQVEMGQGIYTSIAMILAEELDADCEQGRARCTRRPTTSSTPIPIFGVQATGSSTSIRAFWKPLREAGASARAMLIAGRRRAVEGRARELHGVEGRSDSHARAAARSAMARWRRRRRASHRRRMPPLKDPKRLSR